MKKLFLFLIALFPLFVFAVSTPQGEELTVQITGTASNSATISITAKDIIRFTQPLETVTPEIEYRGPTGTVRVTPGNLQCSGTKCNGNFQRSISQLTCNTNYQGLVRVRTRNTTIQSGFLEEPFQFQTRPCVSQLDTVIENVNSTKDTITALVVIPIPTSTPLAGRTSFTFTLTAQKDDSDPISKTVTVSESASTRIETSITLSDLTCESTYEIVASSKIENRDNTPSEPQEVETSSCPPSTSGGGGSQQTTGDNTYVFLTPLPLGEGLDAQDSVVIGAGQGGVLGILQRIFTLMLIAAVVLAVVFMIIGGARYATGDTLGGVQGGRQIITNAVTGLLIALLSWLLLNIINPDLLRFTLSIPNIKEFLSQNSDDPVDIGGNTGNPIPGEGCPASISDEECFERIAEDEPNVRERFEAANILVVGTRSGEVPCEAYDESGCTMVGLLSDATISRLLEVKRDCVAADSACKIQITGGTEYWNHGSGRGGNHGKFIAVDLQLTGSEYAPFKTFIESKTRTANPFGACRETYTYKGLRFCNENGNHWHVDTVSSSGGGQQTSGNLIEFKNIGKNNQGIWGKSSGPYRILSTTELNAKKGCVFNNQEIRTKIKTAAQQNGIDAKLLATVVIAESCADVNAFNPKDGSFGACGLAQIKVETARNLDRTGTQNMSDSAICEKLKTDVPYSLNLSSRHLKSISGDPKSKFAGYNGGDSQNGATGNSINCPGIMRFECPWEDRNASGQLIASPCYDQTKPNDRPTKTDCAINTGYEVTRFYVTNNILLYNLMNGL